MVAIEDYQSEHQLPCEDAIKRILKGVVAYAKSDVVRKKKMIMSPARFFNEHHWTDDPETWKDWQAKSVETNFDATPAQRKASLEKARRSGATVLEIEG